MGNRLLCCFLSVALGMMVLSEGWGAAPPNDSFGTPTVVSGFPAVSAGSNVDATLEAGEPVESEYHEASVWFRWTSPVSGGVQIDTLDSDFDTVLAVWTNNALADLALIAENDQYEGTDQSAVFFDVAAGTEYRIAVYGWRSERGAIALRITNDVRSRISGRVTGPDGATGLPGIRASAYRQNGTWWGWATSVRTAADGTYLLRGLPAGTYRVEFSDAGGDYCPEAYADAATVNDGTDIVVPALTTVTGIDASLAVASKIGGRVTGPDGVTGLAGIQASAHRQEGAGWSWVAAGETAADGTYVIGGLAAGTYRVRFDDYQSGNYRTEVYDNAPGLDSGTDIVVPALTTVTGIDASLAVASKIGGRVTGPDGATGLDDIQVSACRAIENGWSTLRTAYTASDGTYTIDGLESGTYRVRFSAWNGEYAAEVYDNAPDLDSGADIVVGVGETAAGIDASLAVASKIGGRVTGPDGTTPLSGIQATAYRWDGAGWEWIASANTAADGAYVIGGLAAGTYRVRFDDYQSGNYRTEVYDNAPDLDSGADIVVGAGEAAAGIDASLALANEPPALAGIHFSGAGTFEIRFTGTANLDYILQEAHSLTGGWSDVGTAATAWSGMNTLPGSATASQVFWRVRLVP